MKRSSLVFLCLLAACQRGAQTSPPAPAAPGAPPPAGSLPAESLTAKVTPLPQANRYQVELQWDASARGTTRWWILRQEDEVETLGHVDAAEHTFVDGGPQPGHRYRYVVTTEVPAEPVVRLSTEVRVPLDREISGVEELTELRGIRRLFLPPQSEIRPRGSSLFIVVEELVAAGGGIASLPPGATAAPGADGRAAPSLFLRAKRATGTLPIRLTGEAGGSGIKGRPGLPGRPGAQGALSTVRMTSDRTDHWVCMSEAGDGGTGGTGENGFPGGPGGRGGDSARLLVHVDQPTGFQVLPRGEGGAGGLGGLGGDGGPPGPGGPPGYRNIGCFRQALPGALGQPGQPGPTGPNGSTGRRSPVCLKLGTGAFGDCTQNTPDPDWGV